MHAIHIWRLSFNVHGTHIDAAGQPDTGTRGSRCDTVLSRTRFSDNAFRAEPFCEQRLAYRIVDLVRARVCQIFALQPYICAPALTELRRMTQCRWPSDPLAQFSSIVVLKVCFVQVLSNTVLKTLECRHQSLRHIASTEWPKTATLVRQFTFN
jgi:hypothetical protein